MRWLVRFSAALISSFAVGRPRLNTGCWPKGHLHPGPTCRSTPECDVYSLTSVSIKLRAPVGSPATSKVIWIRDRQVDSHLVGKRAHVQARTGDPPATQKQRLLSRLPTPFHTRLTRISSHWISEDSTSDASRRHPQLLATEGRRDATDLCVPGGSTCPFYGGRRVFTTMLLLHSQASGNHLLGLSRDSPVGSSISSSRRNLRRARHGRSATCN